MKLITVTPIRSIKTGPLCASQGDEMLVDLALASFGHLLRSRPPHQYALSEFADIIARHYDVAGDPRTQAVVEALRTVQEQTEKRALELLAIANDTRADQMCTSCDEVFDANDDEVASTWQQVQCPCCGSWEQRQKQTEQHDGV